MKQAIISITIIACMLVATIQPLQFTEHAQAEDLPTFEPQSTTWLDAWEYRKEITISNNIEDYQTKITVSQSDDTSDDVDCEGNCNDNFSDIRFACANGTLVPYWIEEKTDGDDCTVWVKNEYNDTIAYMYYGNSDASDASNGTDTFIRFDDFEGYSIDEDPDGENGWTTDTDGGDGTCKIVSKDGSQVYEGTNGGDAGGAIYNIFSPTTEIRVFHRIQVSSSSKASYGPYVYDSDDTTQIFFVKWEIGSPDYLQYIDTGGAKHAFSPSFTFSANTWYDLEWQYDTQDNLEQTIIYNSNSYGGQERNSPSSKLDRWQFTRCRFNEFYIDDFRIANFTSGTEPNYTFDSQEQQPKDWYDSNWSCSKKITINHSQVAGNLTNFPVCINITDSHLKNNAQADGDDILFTADNITKLNHEIELYNSTSGQLVAWVNVTELSGTEYTTMYMYYGNATCNNQENGEDVWDSNYIMVQHFDEGAASTYVDSAGNYNGSGTSMSITDEKIGVAIGFDGSNDYVSWGDNDMLKSEPITYELWTNPKSTLTGVSVFGARGGGYPDSFRFAPGEPYSFQIIDDNDNSYSINSNSISADTWYHFVGTVDSNGSMELFHNAASCGTLASGGIAATNDAVYLANDEVGNKVDDLVDELRISNIVRNDAWIATTYNTMNNATDGGFFELEPTGPTNTAPNTPTSPECQNATWSNTDHLTDHTPYFDWVFSDSDTNDTQHGFQIQVGNDTDWGTVEMWNYQENTSNNFTTYNGSPLQDGNTYYWRVRVKDNDSAWSDYTSNQQFRMNSVPVPILSTPVNESTEMPYTTKSINLTWTCDADAETDSLNWEWQYARSSDFTVDEVHQWSTGHTYRTIPMTGELYEEEDYFWRVRAWDGIEYGDYSEWRTFRTDAYINLTEPTTENGAADVSVNLNEWSINITHDEGTFNWWINTTPDIGNASGFTETDGIKTCQLSGLEYNTTYEVQVLVIGSSRNETYTFTTEEDPGDHIQVTVSPQAEANITVNRSEWTPAIGITEHTSTTTDWANLENTGSIQVDVTVNISNTANWTAAPTPGHNQFRIIIYNGTTWYDLGNSPITFKENLAYNQDQTLGLQLYMPTSSETNTNQTATITFIATVD